MGGIYIPNVDLPGDGDFELWIAVKKDGSFTYNINGNWREENQKAIPVPPHGRLGDLDNLALLVLNWISTQEKAYPHEDSNALAWRLGAKAMANQIYRDIKAYPTIIEAEEASDELHRKTMHHAI